MNVDTCQRCGKLLQLWSTSYTVDIKVMGFNRTYYFCDECSEKFVDMIKSYVGEPMMQKPAPKSHIE